MSVPARQRALLRLLRLLPQGALSRGWGRVTRWTLPVWLRRPVNRGYARLFKVMVDEAEHPPEIYPSLGAFFVRRLRAGARTWPQDPGVPASPVDGVLGTFGCFDGGTAVQAKGIHYGIPDLLGGDDPRFRSGMFFTIYLSPGHYHRIHAPIGCELREARAVPGRLLPVNASAVRAVRDLFPRNERLVTLMGRGRADIALVAIGAYNVGCIEAVFDPEWSRDGRAGVTNEPARRAIEPRTYVPPLGIERGGELMAFHLGSTVVLLLSGRESLPSIRSELHEGMEIRMGTPLLTGPLEEEDGGIRERRSSAATDASPGRR